MCRLREDNVPNPKPVGIDFVGPVGSEIPLGPPGTCVLGGPYASSGTVPAVELPDGNPVAFCDNLCRHVWLLTHEGRAVSLSGTVQKPCYGCGAALSDKAPT